MTFKDLRRLASREMKNAPRHHLAVLGDTSTQLLVTAIRGTGVKRELDLSITEAEYDQVECNVHDSGSQLWASAPEFVVLQLTSEKLHVMFQETPPVERAAFADGQLERIRNLWAGIRANSGAKTLCFNFAEFDDGVYGDFACKFPGSFRFQIRKLNALLMEAAAAEADVFIVDIAALQARFGRNCLADRKLYYSAKLAIALELLPAVAERIVGTIEAIAGRIKKCLVLDLDNTVWGGIIGEDGLDRIQLGELGIGPAFTDLQRWAKALRERGVILAVCSKNDDHVAREPFERHPDMVLRLDDVAVFMANWETKVDNLKAIREVLDIGLDAMVFLDDNPFERAMVREHLPEVCVPELPEDPAAWLDHLVALNPFEVAQVSAADADRTAQYQREAERKVHQRSYTNVDDYLASLGMVAVAAPFDRFHLPRIAQLTQRSNQFNLRTVRYTEADIGRLAQSNAHITRYITLADRFGDHGLISCIVLEAVDSSTLFIDTWLMSCRVLKRGVEAFVLDEIVSAARAGGFTRVVGEYLPTPKNGLVKELLPSLGFRPNGTQWVIEVDNYKPVHCFIAKVAGEAVPSCLESVPVNVG